MAIFDIPYVFTHIDTGSYGSNNDRAVFRNSKWGEQFFENKVHLLEAELRAKLNKWKGYLLSSKRRSISITVVLVGSLYWPGHTQGASKIQLSSLKSP